MSEKKRIFDKAMTRRQFLKVSGKGMAGLALSTSLLNLFGVTKAEAVSYTHLTFTSSTAGVSASRPRRT